jgi:hypothetical protein
MLDLELSDAQLAVADLTRGLGLDVVGPRRAKLKQAVSSPPRSGRRCSRLA